MWDIIDKVGTVIGILSTIPVVWSLFILLGYRRRQKALIKQIIARPGNRPIALAIGIARDQTPIDITNQVRLYLTKQGMEMDIESLPLPVLRADKTHEFVAELRKMRARLIEKGVDQTHLFYMGPVAGALLVGDVFSNGAVQIYYHNQGSGEYEKWGPLTHPVLI
ncbi:MAG: SAVED domain-containing protein [Gammaproteobacteria bacterium]